MSTARTKHQIDLVARMTKADHVRRVMEAKKAFLVRHDQFREAYSLIEEAHLNQASGDARLGVMIVGKSRVGKTRVLEEYAAQFPDDVIGGKPRRRCVVMTFPNRPSIASIMENLLEKLGDPLARKGSASSRPSRFAKMIKKLGVEVLMFDEAHHLVQHRSPAVASQISSWLKTDILGNGVVCVLAGQESALAMINLQNDDDDQTRNRFLSPITLQPFGSNQRLQLLDLVLLLREMEKPFPAVKELRRTEAEELLVAKRFFIASGGMIGKIVDLAKRALLNALCNGRHAYTMDDLILAHNRLMTDEGTINAFAVPAKKVEALYEQGVIKKANFSTPTRIRGKKKDAKVGDVIQLSR